MWSGERRHFFMLGTLIKYSNRKSDLIGFDSFDGFPEPSSEDESQRRVRKGDSWALVSNKEEIINYCKKNGLKKIVKDGRVKLIPGFFEQTLRKSQTGRIALLHLDVDLYESYKVCLSELFPKVVRGGE